MDVDKMRAVRRTAADHPVIVIGAGGQLGQTMAAFLRDGWTTIPLTRGELDLTQPDAVRRRIGEIKPAAIVNCAGYNDVDRAEVEPELAMESNAFAVRTLARVATEVGATLVHYSSDFVFGGNTDQPYREDDQPDPRSIYAASKLLGDWFAATTPLHYVLRVESLFGGVSRRKSSLDRIIDAIAAGKSVRVFVDRVVSPSYAWDIARATDAVLRTRPPAGLYHCVNSGHASWHDVAMEVRRRLGTDAVLEPITMADVTLAAARPRYCALSNAKLQAAGIEMPAWQDALMRCLAATGR